MSDYKARLERFYKHYAPEKLSNIDNLLSKYKGKEETMFPELVKRYGPEPGPDGKVPPAAAGSTAKKSSPAPGGKSASSPSAKPGGKPSSSSTTTTPAAESDANKKGATVADSSSSSSPGGAAASAPSGESSDATKTPKAGDSGGPSQQDDTAAADDEDVEDALRMIVSKSGFLCQEHEHKWVQCWLGSLPLQLLTREVIPGKNPVIVQAWGHKHARKGLGGPWKRRFFIVVPPFLYYADSDKPSEKCRGCIYLARATIKEEKEKDGKPALSVESRVNRRPDALDSSGDAAAFFINFETERVMDTWKTVLNKVSAAPYNLMTGLIETKHPPIMVGSPTAAGGGGGGARTPTMAFGGGGGGALSPSASMQFINPAEFSTMTATAGTIPLQQPLVGAGTSGYSSPVVPAAAAAAAQQSQQPVVTVDQLQLVQQQMQQQLLAIQQQQQLAASAGGGGGGGGGVGPSTAAASTAVTPNASVLENPPQCASSSSSPPAAASSASPQQALPITTDDLLKRTKKLAADRDPEAVIDILFKHVESFPGDLGVMWRMMVEMEDAKKRDPWAAGQQQLPPPLPPVVSSRPPGLEPVVVNASSPPRQQSTTNPPTPQQQQFSSSQNLASSMRGPSETPSEFFGGGGSTGTAAQQQQQQRKSVDSRSPSDLLAPLSNSSFTRPATGPSASSSPGGGGGGANGNDAVQAALNRSKGRRAAIDQMLSGLPK